jgi:hypothetical protein
LHAFTPAAWAGKVAMIRCLKKIAYVKSASLRY